MFLVQVLQKTDHSLRNLVTSHYYAAVTFSLSNEVAVRHTPLTAILHPMTASDTATGDLIVNSVPIPTLPSHKVIF